MLQGMAMLSSESNNRRLLFSVNQLVGSFLMKLPSNVLAAIVTVYASTSYASLLATILVEYGLPGLEILGFTTTCGIGNAPDAKNITCVACPVGKFKQEPDNSSCITCPKHTSTLRNRSFFLFECDCLPGYTSPDWSNISVNDNLTRGGASCSSCQGDCFCPGRLAHQTCPAHSTSYPGAASIEDCKCTPGYAGPDGGACSACPPGTYKEANGSAACSLCPAGTFSNATAATGREVCLPCG
ncbi:hypothetical protein T484DRAFT_1668101, partial [Baffinella frigidus]